MEQTHHRPCCPAGSTGLSWASRQWRDLQGSSSPATSTVREHTLPGWCRSTANCPAPERPFHFLSKDWGKEGRATAWAGLGNPPSARMAKDGAARVPFELDTSGTGFCSSPHPPAVLLLPGAAVKLHLSTGAFKECTQDLLGSTFLILKSLYLESKPPRTRIPVYFVRTHTLERGGQTAVECFTFH